MAAGGTTFNSPSNPMQTVEVLYSMPASDFNDITTGYTGFSAGPGYDFATGRGTPIANLLIPDLVNYGNALVGSISGPADGVLYQPRTFTFTASGSASDNAAGYTYNINWGDGSPVQTVSATANNTTITEAHTYTATGNFSVSVTATDQNGITSPSAQQAITVGLIAVEADSIAQGGVTGLAISGIAGTSGVVLAPTGTRYGVKVTRDGTLLGTFTATNGTVAVHGDGGIDLVTLDGLSSSANTFALSGDTATFTAAALGSDLFTIGLNGISSITLHGGTKGNSYTFAGSAMGIASRSLSPQIGAQGPLISSSENPHGLRSIAGCWRRTSPWIGVLALAWAAPSILSGASGSSRSARTLWAKANAARTAC